MKKIEFVKEVSKKSGISMKDAEKVINSSLETVTEILEKDQGITFMGFGTFETVVRASRVTTLPNSKQKVTIPAKKSVKFKIGKNLKEKVAAIPVDGPAKSEEAPATATATATETESAPAKKTPAKKAPAIKAKKSAPKKKK
ncbi:bacterial nucleoid DNA-binding protein [Thiovulum sp. ES]|nr:bacterial nucleoid DNA-binding protein [Thiovulum sp. ES]